MNDNFFEQIEKDIKEYQEEFPNNDNIRRDDWAFNYWILDKLYNVDEEFIFEQIIDVHDKGIDCYDFDEENNVLHLIQNKFYRPNLSSSLTNDYLQDLAILPIELLNQGKYNHSQELQNLYTKVNKSKKEHQIKFTLYITKELNETEKAFFYKKFNSEKANNVSFEIKDLRDIFNAYYSDYSDGNNKSLDFDLYFKSEKLLLDMNTEEIDIPIHAKYLMVPVAQFYKMMKMAKDSGYNLFDENIRDYLGSNGKINSKIKETLNDEKDRKYFVYYNNGVTVVCSSLSKTVENVNGNQRLLISNPKIVNGCQTVSTIFEVLNNYYMINDNLDCFNDVYVMSKFLDASSIGDQKEEITKNIVQRNNSQNSIDISIFNIRKKELQRIQSEFKEKGFLLLIKQSDKNTFTNEYKGNKFEDLKNKASTKLTQFNLNYNKVSDYMIPLEKFLQVIYCFKTSAYYGYTRKSKVVKDSKIHNEIVDFILNNGNLENYLDLYLLFSKADRTRKNKTYGDDRTPIPLYLIDFFSRFECENKNVMKISTNLSDNNKVEAIIKKYSNFTRAYAAQYYGNYKIDYNKMIKQKIDESILVNVSGLIKSMIF